MKILVFRPGQLGDTLVALPALWAARSFFPAAHITWLHDLQVGHSFISPPDVMPLHTGLVDNFHAYRYFSNPLLNLHERIHLFRWLQTNKFDHLIYLPPSSRKPYKRKRDIFYFRKAGISEITGKTLFNRDMTYWFEADRLMYSLRKAGIPTPEIGHGCMTLNLDENEKKHNLTLPSDHKVIAVGLGGKKQYQIYSHEKLCEALLTLQKKIPIWPLFFGDTTDKERASLLHRELNAGEVILDTMKIRNAAGILNTCSFYLGNDTGTMHLAAAVGIPCIMLDSNFGIPGLWHPYGRGHIILSNPGRKTGFENIRSENIADACKKLLG